MGSTYVRDVAPLAHSYHADTTSTTSSTHSYVCTCMYRCIYIYIYTHITHEKTTNQMLIDIEPANHHMIGPGLTTYTYTYTYMCTYIPICVHIYICTHRQTTCTYKTEIKIQSKFAPNLASQNLDLNLKTNEPAYVQECRIQEICKIFHISLQNGFLKNSNRRGPGPGPGPCAHHNHCL